MELKHVVTSLIAQAPFLIVYLLAFIIGIVNLGKHKKAGMLVMLGGLIAGLVNLVTTISRPFLMEKFYDSEAGESLSTGFNCGCGLFEAVGVALVVFGAFAGRQPAEDPDDREPRRRGRQSDDDPPAARPAKRVDDRRERPAAEG